MKYVRRNAEIWNEDQCMKPKRMSHGILEYSRQRWRAPACHEVLHRPIGVVVGRTEAALDVRPREPETRAAAGRPVRRPGAVAECALESMLRRSVRCPWKGACRVLERLVVCVERLVKVYSHLRPAQSWPPGDTEP